MDVLSYPNGPPMLPEVGEDEEQMIVKHRGKCGMKVLEDGQLAMEDSECPKSVTRECQMNGKSATQECQVDGKCASCMQI